MLNLSSCKAFTRGVCRPIGFRRKHGKFYDQNDFKSEKLIPIGEQTQKLVVVHKTKDGTVIKTPVMSVVGFSFIYCLNNKGIWQVTIGRRAMSRY